MPSCNPLTALSSVSLPHPELTYTDVPEAFQPCVNKKLQEQRDLVIVRLMISALQRLQRRLLPRQALCIRYQMMETVFSLVELNLSGTPLHLPPTAT